MGNNNQRVAVNELRWLVFLAERVQVPDDLTGIEETLNNAVRVHAKVEDLYPQTFYAAQQTDRPVTHMIWLRWLPWLDTRHVILRNTKLYHGRKRIDVYRIRRVKELNGRKRFLEIEAEQEKREAV
jgi:SPP1 family predicted phage head-tail adaptor